MLLLALVIIGVSLGGGLGFWARAKEMPDPLEILIFFATLLGIVLVPGYVKEALRGAWNNDFVRGFIMTRVDEFFHILSGNFTSVGWVTVAILAIILILTGIIASKIPIFLYASAIGIVTRWVLVTRLGIDPIVVINEMIKSSGVI
jgi:hypothetical protein